MIEVRALTAQDWAASERLYSELTQGPRQLEACHFRDVLAHPGTHVFGALSKAKLCAMATLHLLPNVTWGGRHYGLVENVVTAADQQRQGFGRAVLARVAEAAWEANAYKIMLMTGRKRAAKGFYEACGFSSEDKHAMVIRRP